jgi:hypothetical protein
MLCYNSPDCGAQIEFAILMTSREDATSMKVLGLSPSKKASSDLDHMVPSWRFCMRGANARDIANVRIRIWIAVFAIATRIQWLGCKLRALRFAPQQGLVATRSTGPMASKRQGTSGPLPTSMSTARTSCAPGTMSRIRFGMAGP